MKNKLLTVALMSSGLLFAGACKNDRNNRSEVQETVGELKEARQETSQRVSELEEDLAQAKQQVLQLEQELALAREGITDEVLEKRAEVKEALHEAEQEARAERTEAQKEATQFRKDVDRAAQQLEETRPPADVSAEIKTETQIQEPTGKVTTPTEREQLEFERVKGIEGEERSIGEMMERNGKAKEQNAFPQQNTVPQQDTDDVHPER